MKIKHSTSNLHPYIEQTLQANIFPDLKNSRKDFDLQHTKAVVYWMKKLISNINIPTLDPQVLITAAYAHDWGYFGLFEGIDSNNLDEIMKKKPLHMQRGSEKINHLIKTKLSKYFNPKQTRQVTHLVKVHDLVEDLKSDEELILMEADTLGMIDTDVITPSFDKKNLQKHIKNELLGRRIPLFFHPYAKQQAEICLKKIIKFHKNKK